MSKKKIFYFFPSNGMGARILVNPSTDILKMDGIFLIEPNLSKVQGISPSFWKLVDGQILPMTKEEREAAHTVAVHNVMPKEDYKALLEKLSALDDRVDWFKDHLILTTTKHTTNENQLSKTIEQLRSRILKTEIFVGLLTLAFALYAVYGGFTS